MSTLPIRPARKQGDFLSITGRDKANNRFIGEEGEGGSPPAYENVWELS